VGAKHKEKSVSVLQFSPSTQLGFMLCGIYFVKLLSLFSQMHQISLGGRAPPSFLNIPPNLLAMVAEEVGIK